MKSEIETLITSTVNGAIVGKSILILSARNLAGVNRQYVIQPIGGTLSIKVIENGKEK